MSDNPPRTIPIEKLASILGTAARWRLLRELATGEVMPGTELARRIGKTPAQTSKHLAVLRAAGLVVAKYGRLYQLIPTLLPPSGATHLDLGYCLLKLPNKP